MQHVLYTDRCNPIVEDKIGAELHLSVVKRMPEGDWNIQDASKVLTDPRICLAVFNNLDEISLMEIGLLLFLCKPILIADKAVEEYAVLAKQVDYVDPACNLKELHNAFVSWFNYMELG